MKQCLGWLLCLVPLYIWGAQEPEIVIELTGTPAPQTAAGISVWDKSARELMRLFKDKTRTDMLYTLENVSTRDGIVHAKDGKKYVYVQYGQDTQYRKCLFQVKDPQTLITCVDNIDDALKAQKKYGVDFHISQHDLVQNYSGEVSAQEIRTLQTGRVQTVYILTNTAFVFDKGILVHTFENPQQAVNYIKEQTTPVRTQPAPAAQTVPTYKALISGGTVKDRQYLPHVKQPPADLPPLTPGGPPAGTPEPVPFF